MIGSDRRLINPEVRIETTTRCQDGCIFCPREKLTRPITDMTFELYMDIFQQARDLGMKTATLFGFGEPLFDHSLPEKVAYATSYGVETFITTNASLLTEERSRRLLEAGLKHVRFSVHALDPAVFAMVQPRLDFDVVMNNISRFLAMNECQAKPCMVSVTVIPVVEEKVSDIRKFWESRVHFLEIWRPHNWGGKSPFREGRRQKNTCGRPFNGPVQINVDGSVMVCCFDFNGEMTIGTLKDNPHNSLGNILEGGPLRVIQRKHLRGEHEGLPCKDCDQLNEYGEGEWPLLYSSRDPDMKIGVTSSCKIPVE